jgi:hypothetical protein
LLEVIAVVLIADLVKLRFILFVSVLSVSHDRSLTVYVHSMSFSNLFEVLFGRRRTVTLTIVETSLR